MGTKLRNLLKSMPMLATIESVSMIEEDSNGRIPNWKKNWNFVDGRARDLKNLGN